MIGSLPLYRRTIDDAFFNMVLFSTGRKDVHMHNTFNTFRAWEEIFPIKTSDYF